MKSIALFFLITASLSSHAEVENNCAHAIKRHLKEAIVHNKSVTQEYANLSEGKSLWLSKTLVSLEKLSLLTVDGIESEASVYQQKGIPVLCEEIADMKTIPTFRDKLPANERPVEFYRYDTKAISKKIKTSLENNDLDKAYEAISLDLTKLESEPNQLCLTRHFLESMARTLLLSSKRREEAKAQGLSDPLFLIKKFVNQQRQALPFTHYLDKKAFPLQQDGLLLFCQDLPAISWK